MVSSLKPFNSILKYQFEMLQKAVLHKKNCVITSGTGSGKTESFLLPLFASISKEAVKYRWRNQTLSIQNRLKQMVACLGGERYRQILDFSNGRLSNGALQRGHETRPAAIRALLLYPMNALVEDQMTRLRTSLDSDKARRFFDSEDWQSTSLNKWKHNRIYFGRYNGATPIPGVVPIITGNEDPIEEKGKLERGQSLVSRLKKELRDLDENSQIVNQYILIIQIKKIKIFFRIWMVLRCLQDSICKKLLLTF